MNTENEIVTQFLRAVMQAHENLNRLAGQLRCDAEVIAVKVYPFVPENMTQHHWDEIQQKKAVGAEFGVSAELRDGAVTDWWINVRCEEENGWFVSASLFKSDKDEDGCHSIAEFEEGNFLTFPVALQRLTEATAWLAERQMFNELPSMGTEGGN